MKILKVLGIIFGVILIILASVFFWLFSKSGNDFLKNTITKIVNEKAPIGLEFTHFKLGFSDFAFSLADKQQSQIALSGNYSLFTFNTNAQINAVVKDLRPYEQLIGIPLNGGVNLNGEITKKSDNLSFKADLNAFKSTINVDVILENYNPKKLFITSKEGINLQSLLAFLNQPSYANGKILLNADLDISDLTSPNGGFQIASDAISPNNTLLQKEYNLTLPKEPIKLAINGKAKANHILTTILANSSYFQLTSEDLLLNLKDYSTNGNLKTIINNIRYNNFAIKTPISGNINLKSNDITNQEATLSLYALTNPILVHSNIPHYKPENAVIKGKDLSIKEILDFTALPYKAQGIINLDAEINTINLTPLNYNLKANLSSSIQSLIFNGLNLASNNSLEATINGNPKTMNIETKSDLFDSKIYANALLKDYSPNNIVVDLENLNLQKISKLLNYDVYGFLSAKATLNNFKDSSFDGNFDLNTSELTLPKQTLNTLSGMEFKHDIVFALNGEGKFKQGEGKAELKATGKDITLKISNALINPKDNAYSADFNFHTPNIANINPLKLPLQGKLTLKGNAGFSDNLPKLYVANQDFGDLELTLANELLKINANNLSAKKIADFTGNSKFIKDGIFNANANLTLKLENTIKNLNGPLRIQGKNIQIYSLDIDALANNYEKTNQINLLDIGAFVLAGPLGVAATKGGDLGQMGLNTILDTKTAIKELEADIDFQKGIANAKDVAFATTKTRIAAKGAINLNNQSFDNFYIGLLNANNCAKYSQKIEGTLANPKIQITQTAVNTAINLAASLLDKVTKGAKTITKPITNQEENCKPFYDGAVKHPNK
ncbi:translocation/assembly module TamB domain-containing protein [Helicobacter mesocricetorum]|uniref:hypothetical protein n=1 Tax=Helicobacter mesocricetorum TaxID=87012 RepID=UPI000CF07A24|nr:hypothetical protein [Helicobacter mesocricetorum]